MVSIIRKSPFTTLESKKGPDGILVLEIKLNLWLRQCLKRRSLEEWDYFIRVILELSQVNGISLLDHYLPCRSIFGASGVLAS